MRRVICVVFVFQMLIFSVTGQFVKISVHPGKRWVHKFKVMPLFSVKTRPQMAFWSVDEDGIITAYFVTEKFAKASWRGAPGDKSEKRKPSALPYFTFALGKGQQTLPTRSNPLPDTVTYATPEEGFENTFSAATAGTVVFYFEVNHSTDFNDYYRKGAKPGDTGYSGGKTGSGQPALVYTAIVDLSVYGQYTMKLAGRSSADGNSGTLYEDMNQITDARDIIKDVIIEIIKDGDNENNNRM